MHPDQRIGNIRGDEYFWVLSIELRTVTNFKNHGQRDLISRAPVDHLVSEVDVAVQVAMMM